MNEQCDRARENGESPTLRVAGGNRVARLRARQIVLCLSAALLPQVPIAAAPSGPFAPVQMQRALARNPHHPDAPIKVPVLNCDDDGPDSLRDVVKNKVQSGYVVDLSGLPAKCGTQNSVITLKTEIAVGVDDLGLLGPEPGQGSVKVASDGSSRLFKHQGSGTLTIENLTVADGVMHAAANNAYGGCISSTGSVYLKHAVVSGCTASSDHAYAAGGAIQATSKVTLQHSAVTTSKTEAPDHGGIAGGIYANGLYATYSTISGNKAEKGQYASYAGGARVTGFFSIESSTIDNNEASQGGALTILGSGSIVNSTISENKADTIPALQVQGSSLEIYNTTIAFNHANLAISPAAVRFSGFAAGSPFRLQSSIIAMNTESGENDPSDLAMDLGTLTGADNLVMKTTLMPAMGVITVTTDPKLGPLQPNGGPTRTHMLLPGSPALRKGNNVTQEVTDQRGFGYSRTTSIGGMVKADIGAVEYNEIFFGDFDSH